MSTVSGIDSLSQREALGVEVGRIENELGAVWRDAGRGIGDDANGLSAIARTALWNIVIPTRGSVALTAAKTMISAIETAIPARMIVIGRNDASRSPEIRSSIASKVVSGSDGAPVVCSEEITLTGPSGSNGHLGALVRALRIPNLPTATLAMDSTVMDGLVTRELLPWSDRLVIDTERCEHPDELAVLHRLTADSVNELSDLGWEKLSSVRQPWSAMFDGPGGLRPLRGATRVTIEHHPRHVSSALLLGAWFAGQLGWSPIDAKRIRDGQLRFRFTTDGADARRPTIELHPGTSDGECGPTGIISIEVRCPADLPDESSASDGYDDEPACLGESIFSLRCTSRNQAELSTPTARSRSVMLDTRSDLEICVGVLGPDGRDPLLRQVLAYAARLADRLAERTDRQRGRTRLAPVSNV